MELGRVEVVTGVEMDAAETVAERPESSKQKVQRCE